MSGILPQLAVVVAGCLGILAVIRGIGYLGDRHGWHAEVQRKAVHVATGVFAMALPYLVADRWPVIGLLSLGLVVMAAMRIPALAGGFGRALHGVKRKSYGELLLALAVGFVFLRSHDNLVLYEIPLAVITLSDTAAALAGTAYGRRVFHVERGTKSVEGVTTFFLVTWIVAMSMLITLSDVPRESVLPLAVTVAVFGALVEMDSWQGLDNLFVPVAVHLYLSGYLYAPVVQVLALAAVFVAAIVAVALATPRLRFMSGHAARAYCVSAFLLVGVSGLLAAILPVLAVPAHIWARVRRPPRGAFPDLDLLATLVGMALIWLAVGQNMGPSAINMYEASVAGIIAAFAALALGRRAPAIAACAIVLLALHTIVVSLTQPSLRWHGGLAGCAAATLALCAAAAFLRPGWFDRWRAPRAAALASAIPMSLYLWMVLR